jgi:hypothetical protein
MNNQPKTLKKKKTGDHSCVYIYIYRERERENNLYMPPPNHLTSFLFFQDIVYKAIHSN